MQQIKYDSFTIDTNLFQIEQKADDLRIWRTFYERQVLKMLDNCWSWQNFWSIYIDALTLKL